MSIFYNKIEFQIEFYFSRESKTIKFHTYINLKIEIELQIEPRFKKQPSVQPARNPLTNLLLSTDLIYVVSVQGLGRTRKWPWPLSFCHPSRMLSVSREVLVVRVSGNSDLHSKFLSWKAARPKKCSHGWDACPIRKLVRHLNILLHVLVITSASILAQGSYSQGKILARKMACKIDFTWELAWEVEVPTLEKVQTWIVSTWLNEKVTSSQF